MGDPSLLSETQDTRSQSYKPSKILVAIDGSENSKRALQVATGIAQTYHVELLILNVIPNPSALITTLGHSGFGISAAGMDQYFQQQEDAASIFITEALDLAKSEGIPKVDAKIEHASTSIVGEIIDVAAYSQVDLIVIGTRGLGGFKKLVMGSVSSGVVTHAHCNVLVVR